MVDLPEGAAAAAAEFVPADCSPSLLEANPSEICQENWAAADKATRELIRKVEPTSVSEDRRRKVVDYIQRLIRNCLGAEVFPYGSVPLKTYLPDGDIDLTAFGGANVEDTLVDDISLVLEEEVKNTASEFVVKDVQIIRAEVKLVKCIVQDIVVDVSFNQIGGLCTLCFLEQVDRFIGKDHLFKRSIILIKAWCYYESRILGAHHGLISTYALETLVLYIFHFFHSTLDGPLAVLYKFLDYFSKFDWDTYCISLHGPVLISSMPEIVVEIPEDFDADVLLSNDFLSSCVSKFSVPSTSGDKTLRAFQRKHLNIIDPLKEINNLGRSVSKGNFYRIRSAFSYGARKLALMLWQPKISIANELHKFFQNTMTRHGGEEKSDVQDFEPSQFLKRPIHGVHIPETVSPKIHNTYTFEGYVNSNDYQQHNSGRFSKDLPNEMESTSSQMENIKEHSSSVLNKETVLLNRDQPLKPSTLDHSSCEDSNNLDASGLGTHKCFPDSSMNQTPVAKDAIRAVSKPLLYAPHLFFSKSKVHDDSVKDINQDPDKLYKYEKNASSSVVGVDESQGAVVGGCLNEKQLMDRETVASKKPITVLSAPKSSSTSKQNHKDMEPYSSGRSDKPESLSSSDLTGDYDGYFRCLQSAKWCCEYGSGVHSLHRPPLSTALYQNNSPWDGLPPVAHFKQNGFTHLRLNGFHPNQPVYAIRPVLIPPGVAFGWEEAPKPKGTGTYIPNTNQSPQGYRSTTMKGKNQAASRSPSSNEHMADRRSHEIPPPQVHVEKSSEVSSSPNTLSFLPHRRGLPKVANGSQIQPEPVVESDVEHGPGSSVLGQIRQERPVPLSPRASTGAQMSEPPLREEQDRIPLRSSYHLRDEDDFPPLSVQNGIERLSVV